MSILVSIIIPCRNEEKFIAQCLDSLIAQNFPKDRWEILVVDGNSEDKTKEIARDYQNKYPFIRLLDNPKKTTPISMNIGIKESKGLIVLKIDAHAVYDKNYVRNCLKTLKDYKADNVGGILISQPANKTLRAKAIAFSLTSFFGAGNSYFRTGSKQVREVDTVSFGCYRKDVFERIGLYNEKLTRSQDMELNMRLKKAGGKIILSPDIIAYYYPKSTFYDFFIHNFKDGFWSVYPLKIINPITTKQKFGVRAGMPLKLRHYIPLAFILTLLITGLFISSLFEFIIIIYLLASFCFSFKFAIKEMSPAYFIFLPIAFAIRHIGYGLGSLWGLIKLLTP